MDPPVEPPLSTSLLSSLSSPMHRLHRRHPRQFLRPPSSQNQTKTNVTNSLPLTQHGAFGSSCSGRCCRLFFCCSAVLLAQYVCLVTVVVAALLLTPLDHTALLVPSREAADVRVSRGSAQSIPQDLANHGDDGSVRYSANAPVAINSKSKPAGDREVQEMAKGQSHLLLRGGSPQGIDARCRDSPAWSDDAAWRDAVLRPKLCEDAESGGANSGVASIMGLKTLKLAVESYLPCGAYCLFGNGVDTGDGISGWSLVIDKDKGGCFMAIPDMTGHGCAQWYKDWEAWMKETGNKIIKKHLGIGSGKAIAVDMAPEPEPEPAPEPEPHDEQPSFKPLLLLHIGPAKTATTTLQCYFGAHSEMLQRDGIYYLGNFYNNHDCGISGPQPRRPVNVARGIIFDKCASFACVKMADSRCNCEKAWEQFDAEMGVHRAKNHTVLISEEVFANFFAKRKWVKHMDSLVSYLRNWQVQIIFTYRRLYALLPSSYYQEYDPDPAGEGDPFFKLHLWPDQGGRVIPSVEKYFQESFQYRFGELTDARDRWKEHFSMRMANMHNGGDNDFLRSFICNTLKEAAKLCRFRIENPEVARSNAGSSKSLHWDQLAVAAYHRGWIDKTVGREAAREAVKKYSKTKGLVKLDDFKLLCLSDEKKMLLLKQSLDYEQETVPDFYVTTQGEDALRTEFEEAVPSAKYCSVDVDSTLDENPGEWKQLFASLAEKSIER